MDLSQNVSTFESSPEYAPIGKLAIVIGKQDDGTELVYRSVYDETAYRPPAEDIPDFSSSQKYVVGDYCIYNDYVYRCSTPITSPGEWDSSDWTLISEDNPSWDDVEGYALTVKCPWGTQVMANNLLAALGGVTYQPYVAGGALIDPAAELGDAVYVGGITSVVYTMDTTFDALYTADISAPQEEEIDHEYPYESSANREIKREAATITAQLRVDVDSITAEVAGIYAPEWASGTSYYKGSAVKITATDGTVTYYECIAAHTADSTNKPPNATYWSVISAPSVASMVKVGLDGIALSISSSTSGSKISLTQGGVTIESPTIDINVKAANVTGALTAATISADDITAGTISASVSINAPTITGGTITGATVTSSATFQSTEYGVRMDGGELAFFYGNGVYGYLTLGGAIGDFTIGTTQGYNVELNSTGFLNIYATKGICLKSGCYGSTLPTTNIDTGRVFFKI